MSLLSYVCCTPPQSSRQLSLFLKDRSSVGVMLTFPYSVASVADVCPLVGILAAMLAFCDLTTAAAAATVSARLAIHCLLHLYFVIYGIPLASSLQVISPLSGPVFETNSIRATRSSEYPFGLFTLA